MQMINDAEKSNLLISEVKDQQKQNVEQINSGVTEIIKLTFGSVDCLKYLMLYHHQDLALILFDNF